MSERYQSTAAERDGVLVGGGWLWLGADGWFDENPYFATASEQFQRTYDTVATSDARIGPFDTVRAMSAESKRMSDGKLVPTPSHAPPRK